SISYLSSFLSSRRRHTSFSRDWSSDVCSSDLLEQQNLYDQFVEALHNALKTPIALAMLWKTLKQKEPDILPLVKLQLNWLGIDRSEERREGKEVIVMK